MLLWLNGAFGVGKTTTAREIVARSSGRRLFDPELVGLMLQASLRDHPFQDFQEMPAWRALVLRVADEISRQSGEELVAVQTVLVEGIWRELCERFTALGIDVFHVVLNIKESALRERIAGDTLEADAKAWRLSHIEAFLAARAWMTAEADLVVDVTVSEPRAAASAVLQALLGRR